MNSNKDVMEWQCLGHTPRTTWALGNPVKTEEGRTYRLVNIVAEVWRRADGAWNWRVQGTNGFRTFTGKEASRENAMDVAEKEYNERIKAIQDETSRIEE